MTAIFYVFSPITPSTMVERFGKNVVERIYCGGIIVYKSGYDGQGCRGNTQILMLQYQINKR